MSKKHGGVTIGICAFVHEVKTYCGGVGLGRGQGTAMRKDERRLNRYTRIRSCPLGDILGMVIVPLYLWDTE